jgi:hypothetical protein
MDTDQIKQETTYALLRDLGVPHAEALAEYLVQAWRQPKVEKAAADPGPTL